jgi:hypothetical protein
MLPQEKQQKTLQASKGQPHIRGTNRSQGDQGRWEPCPAECLKCEYCWVSAEWMNVWLHRCMDGWMDAQMDGWMRRQAMAKPDQERDSQFLGMLIRTAKMPTTQL